jgi:integrase
MCREYYLHKRPHGVYYVEFVDKETGKKLTARSTQEKDPLKARVKAELWRLSGVPTGKTKAPRPVEAAAGIENIIKAIRKTELSSDDALWIVSTLTGRGLIDIAAVKNSGRGSMPFLRFLESFWNYDESEYIRDRLAHGYRLSRRYAHDCLIRVKSVKAFFEDKKLNCVTTSDLKDLSVQLAEKGLATSTINLILLACCTPLKWAFTEKIIPSNPATGLTKFSITNKERGILSESEAKAVFSVRWKDKRAFVASLVAATTGARQGECLALRRSDIGDDTLNIAQSYSRLEGLKCPKNGHKRVVPLLPEVRAALLDLLEDNPHEGNNPFIFFSSRPHRPVKPQVLLDGLKAAIKTVNKDYHKAARQAEKEKLEIYINSKARNITFHSWRHWFCSKITQRIEGEKVAKISGHLSESIFRRYADHIEAKNIREVGEAAAETFGEILRFRKGT